MFINAMCGDAMHDGDELQWLTNIYCFLEYHECIMLQFSAVYDALLWLAKLFNHRGIEGKQLRT
jgi:hypothetical protein